MRKFIAAAIQFAPQSLAVAENLDRMVDWVGRAAAEGAKLVVFPELSDTGYVRWPAKRNELNQIARYMDAANPIPGPSTEALAAAAKKHDVYIVAGLGEADAQVPGRMYNSSALISPEGQIVGKQHKVTCPMAEKFYFSRGNSLNVFETELGKLGIIICYDNLSPEPARVMTLKGAEVLCSIWDAAHPPESDDSKSPIPPGFLARTIAEVPLVRAMENVIYVVSSSRVGQDDYSGGFFLGNSLIAAPWGEALAEAGLDEEKMITAEIDLGLLPEVRATRPILRDRRPDLYQEISRITD